MKVIMVVDAKGFPRLRTAALSVDEAWHRFFDSDGGKTTPGVCLGDAEKAYRAIGYRTIEFELTNPREVVSKYNNVEKCFSEFHVDDDSLTKEINERKYGRYEFKLVYVDSGTEEKEKEKEE